MSVLSREENQQTMYRVQKRAGEKKEKGNLSARFGFFFLIEWFSILSLYKNNFIIVFISKEHRYLYTIYKRDIPEKA